MIALVAGGTLNYTAVHTHIDSTDTCRHTSSAANLSTAVNGVFSGTLSLYREKHSLCSHKHVHLSGALLTHTLYGNFGSDVSVILNVTFDAISLSLLPLSPSLLPPRRLFTNSSTDEKVGFIWNTSCL